MPPSPPCRPTNYYVYSLIPAWRACVFGRPFFHFFTLSSAVSRLRRRLACRLALFFFQRLSPQRPRLLFLRPRQRAVGAAPEKKKEGLPAKRPPLSKNHASCRENFQKKREAPSPLPCLGPGGHRVHGLIESVRTKQPQRQPHDPTESPTATFFCTQTTTTWKKKEEEAITNQRRS